MRWKMALLALLALTWAADAEAAPKPSILGEWSGSYSCAQGLTALRLTITAASGKGYDALFVFGPLKDNPAVPHGSFHMHGSFEARSGRLQLAPGDWVEQPSGYVTVSLDGRLARRGEEIVGIVPAAGCSTFDLRRAAPLVG